MDHREGDETDRSTGVDATVDRSGGQPRLVIADADREEAWVSVAESEACSLSRWR